MKILNYHFTEEENVVVDYIFKYFQIFFPDVDYSYRNTIIGIGEKNRHLMAYFYCDHNKVYVKFKGHDSLLLLSDRSLIDNLIKETIQLFQSTELILKKRRKNSPDAFHSENSTTNKPTLDTDEKNRFLKLLANINEDIDLPSLCSTRLRNRLILSGINTVGDLKRFSTNQLMQIRNFGVKCYSELILILEGINNSESSEEGKPTYIIEWLSSKPNNSADITVVEENPYVITYLTSINYDEQAFREGSIGYYLCLKKKISNFNFQISLNFSDITTIYKIYSDNSDQLDLIYLQLIEYIEMVSNILLNEREKRIFLMRLGLTADNTTLESIGKVEGVTRERIRQILVKIYRKINRRSFKLLPVNFYKMNLIKQMEEISIEAFVFYLIYRENLSFLFNFLFKVFFNFSPKNLSINEILKYEKELLSAQKFNSKVLDLITTFDKKTFISNTAWERLQQQRHICDHEDSFSGIFTYENRDYEYESNEELQCLKKFLQNKTFKDIKTQSLCIDLPNGRRYFPDFQCLTHENTLVIIEIKPLLKMCEQINVLKFKSLKAYCEKYGFSYLITDSAFRSFDAVATENKAFNQRIISVLPLKGVCGLRVYKEICNETGAKVTDLMWLVTHSNVQFSTPFSITLK